MNTTLKRGITPLASIGIVVGLMLAYAGSTVWADFAAGFAWGGTESDDGAYDGMGWIDVSAVDIPTSDGPITGHAWSGGTTGELDGGYGWISFNGVDLAGCDLPLAQAQRTGNAITGGARILSIVDDINASGGNNAGGFDGCISLDGVTVDTGDNTLNGYAWSSDLGWIDMNAVQLSAVSSGDIVIIPTPCSIPVGGSSCDAVVTWTTNSATSPKFLREGVTLSSDPAGSHTESLTPTPVTFYLYDGVTVLDTQSRAALCLGTWNAITNICEAEALIPQ